MSCVKQGYPAAIPGPDLAACPVVEILLPRIVLLYQGFPFPSFAL